MISFNDDIGGALQKACDHDYYSDTDAIYAFGASCKDCKMTNVPAEVLI